MSTIFNLIGLIGNLTRDAEIKFTQGGTAIVRFSIAQTDRRKKGNEWTDYPMFFDVMMMGKGAEAVHKYLTKGKQVAVEGQLKQDRWTDNNGENKTKIYIFCDSLQLLGGREGNQEQRKEPEKQASTSFDSEEFEDDIPF